MCLRRHYNKFLGNIDRIVPIRYNYNDMRTVSQVVEQIIHKSPFLAEAMAEGLANNAQIARRIKPEVEEVLLEEVSEGSIAMALHRIGKASEAVPYGTRFLKQMSDITVRSNLVQFVFPNSADLSAVLGKVSRIAKNKKGVFLNFSRGLYESLLVVSHEIEEEVVVSFENQKYLKRIGGLSAITMRLPEESLNVPGLYYPILKAIAEDGISLVEVMSIGTEFSTIFADKDIDRAFSAIKRITS